MSRRRERRRARRAARKQRRAERRSARKDALKGLTGLKRLTKNIGIRQKNFRKNNAEIAKGHVQDIRESRPFDAIDSMLESRFRRLRARYWRTNADGTIAQFPEQALPEIQNRPNHGICFSGGGTRSALASFGTMRALNELGLSQEFKYTSGVSGGTWFVIPWTFQPASISDGEFFGHSVRLDQLQGTDAQIKEAVLNSHFSSKFSKAVADSAVWNSIYVGGVADELTDIFKPTAGAADEAWSRAVGHHFLREFDLYDAQRINSSHSFFTWSAKTKAEARHASKFLDDIDFITTHHSRPYSIAGGSLLGQPGVLAAAFNGISSSSTMTNAGQFEMTPLYSGMPTSRAGMGGGYIESYAVDKRFKKFAGDTQFLTKANSPKHKRFTLSDMIGIASSAMGMLDLSAPGTPGLGLNFLTPNILHWSFSSPENARNLNVVDGGYLENLGIMPLLRRKVKRIIVCDNPGISMTEKGKVTGSISHLFGEREAFWETNYSELLGRFKNTVFSNANGEFAQLLNGLRANQASTGVTHFRQTLSVVENANYGVKPYEVEVLWIVLDSSPWTKQIGQKLAAQTSKKKASEALIASPNFKTARLNVTGEEAGLIANHTGTAIHKIAGEVTSFLA